MKDQYLESILLTAYELSNLEAAGVEFDKAYLPKIDRWLNEILDGAIDSQDE